MVENPQDIGLTHIGSGKVRELFLTPTGEFVMQATDRISAFDVVFEKEIPHKGKVLNQLSAHWFKRTSHIIPNHMISTPTPDSMRCIKADEVIPLEFVVRGYITGVTSTSIWTLYEQGKRTIYNIDFPDGLGKNERLENPIITPTTKEKHGHDQKITKDEILERGIMTPEMWGYAERTLPELFIFGGQVCAANNLILVDTKYELGLRELKDGESLAGDNIFKDNKGRIVEMMLIDELHTPDSSRFWLRSTAEELIAQGKEPDSFDKEFFRRHYVEQLGYKGEGPPPPISPELQEELSRRYIFVCKAITGEKIAT